MFIHQHHYIGIRTGLRFRAAVQNLVYRKSLKMSASAKSKSSTGQIVNHMSADANKLMWFLTLVNFIWTTPLQTCVVLGILIYVLGVSSLAGVAIMIIAIPIQTRITRKMTNLQTKILEKSDLRLKQINELIQGIKVIKLYAWEQYFVENILKTRAEQLKVMFHSRLYRAITSLVMQSTPPLVALAAFGK